MYGLAMGGEKNTASASHSVVLGGLNEPADVPHSIFPTGPGPKGDKGEQGDIGPVGPKGDIGDIGDTGPQGLPGSSPFELSPDGTTYVLSGFNLQIVSGSGATNAAVNGLGNLIVGYNENPATFLRARGATTSWWARRMATRRLATVAPAPATRSSRCRYSSVSGGTANGATGEHSSISGGLGHLATGTGSWVGGGRMHKAYGLYSSVSGGLDNEASGLDSSVSGGYLNNASGGVSSISGGQANVSGGAISSISGGFNNTTSATAAWIVAERASRSRLRQAGRLEPSPRRSPPPAGTEWRTFRVETVSERWS